MKMPWQSALINAVTHPEELIELLELDKKHLDGAKKAHELFPLKVPRGFLKKIKKGDINDPILRQILPISAEDIITKGYTKDPLQEKAINPNPGLLHKYHGRVLLTLTPSCSINCRYCFRRHFPYSENNPGKQGLAKNLQYIAADESIKEVILSGGDPLLMNDEKLHELITELEKIPHIARLRIHSRMPIVLPERITDDLVNILQRTDLKTILVTHSNHPNEIDTTVVNSLSPLIAAGVTLLNQAVLLKGVNNDVKTLAQLSEKLFTAGILPYYLHLLDKVQGAAHFDTERDIAKELHFELKKLLPGFLVPRLVVEKPGAPAKTDANLEDFYTG